MESIREIQNQKMFREYTFTRSDIDEKSRSIKVSFSSEEPYERYFGIEILDHGKNSVILDRLNRGGALLMDHEPRDQVGVIERAYIGADRKGRAVVRFGKSQRADEIFSDVKDGIRQNLSVGYKIHSIKQEDSDPANPVFRATKWEPLEISLVSVPADTSVGVNRAETNIKQRIFSIMTTDRTTLEKEKNRTNEILAYGQQFNCQSQAAEAVKNGTSVEDFRHWVLNNTPKSKPVSTPDLDTLGLSTREVRDFRIVRALNAMANPTNRAANEAAGYEFEVSKAWEKQSGRSFKGLAVPPDVMLHRDLTVGTDSAGGYLVGTNLLAGSMVELLRNKSVVIAAGATVLNGLSGEVAIPKVSAGATAYWLAESDTVTESQQTVAQVALTPKTIGALTEYSRRLMVQSSVDVENFVRQDLMATIATAVDLAALHGSGSSNQPTGVASTTGIGSVAGGTNGLAPGYSHIIQLETEVAQDNADIGRLAYITNAKVRGKLKQVFTNATYGEIPLWTANNDGEGRLNGYPAYATNQVSSALTKGSSSGVCSAVFFGNWAELLIGLWSGIDILVDPYTNSATGAVRITAFQDLDINVRHAQSFAAMLDALTA